MLHAVSGVNRCFWACFAVCPNPEATFGKLAIHLSFIRTYKKKNNEFWLLIPVNIIVFILNITDRDLDLLRFMIFFAFCLLSDGDSFSKIFLNYDNTISKTIYRKGAVVNCLMYGHFPLCILQSVQSCS